MNFSNNVLPGLYCAMLIALFGAAPLTAQSITSTTFTYQGSLKSADTAANGSHDFRLKLFDTAVAGQQIGAIIEQSNVQVTDGLFTLPLDFGAVFDGTGRWLEIEVKATGQASYTLLVPRQTVLSSPQAIFANQAESANAANVADVATTATSALNGVPAGFSILGTSQTPPPGFTWSGEMLGGTNEHWTSLIDHPNDISNVEGAAVIDTRLYVVKDSAVSVYDTLTDYWTVYPGTLPGFERTNYSVVSAEGNLYAIGGQSPFDKRLDMYVPETNTWVSRASAPFSINANRAAATLNGKIHCVRLANHCVYDPATDAWSTLESPPITDRQFYPAAVNGKLYIFDSSESEQYTFVYDPVLDDGPGGATAWASMAPRPTARWGLAPVVLNGNIHLLGGFKSGGTYFDYHEIYNPETNAWTTGLPLPASTAFYGAGVISNRIYLVGGTPTPYTTRKYTPTTPAYYVHTKD